MFRIILYGFNAKYKHVW